MSHASECPNHGPVFEVEDIGCPYCDAIRKAYQHGRNDAAEAVEAAADITSKYMPWYIAIDAARGSDK